MLGSLLSIIESTIEVAGVYRFCFEICFIKYSKNTGILESIFFNDIFSLMLNSENISNILLGIHFLFELIILKLRKIFKFLCLLLSRLLLFLASTPLEKLSFLLMKSRSFEYIIGYKYCLLRNKKYDQVEFITLRTTIK